MQLKRRSVFKDESKLDINYVPYRLPHRNRELRLLTEFFSFLLHNPGGMTQRVLIIGRIGTGKTVLAQRFGLNVKREAEKLGIKLQYVHVNCREYRGSLFLILHKAVSIFHPNFPKRGYSAEELLQILMQVLDEQDTHLILTLDEFESLIEREGSEAVYKLTRLQETRVNKPQRLSLICILRKTEILEKLDESTRSTLQSNIIKLEQYSKNQLEDILKDRVNLAFNPSAVPEDVVSLIADIASSEGNARLSIELLWRAGKYADLEKLDVVTAECVRKAASNIYPIRKSELSILNLHEKLLLLGIARSFKENEKAYLSMREAEKAYKIACEEFNVQPHSHTQMWKHLKYLSTLNIIKTEVSKIGRGRSTIIYLPLIPAYELERELNILLERRGNQL